MSTQVRSETSRQKNKKNITKKKTKRKLELALNFFFYFDHFIKTSLNGDLFIFFKKIIL